MAIPDLLVQYGLAVPFAWAFVVQAGVSAPAIPMLVGAGALSGSGKMHLLLAIAAAATGISLYTRLPSPPNFSKTIARIAFFQVIGTDSGCEEIADRRRDLVGVCFQREVARVEKPDGRTRNIPLERLGARRQENGSFLPHTLSSRGWCVRKYAWNFGYSATLLA